MPAFARSSEMRAPVFIRDGIAVNVYRGKPNRDYPCADIASRIDGASFGGMTIGARIKQARTAKGLTQQELAQKIGETKPKFSSMNVSRWETGLHSVSAENVRLASQALGVSVDWLMNGDEAPVTESRVEQDIFTPEQLASITDFLGFEPTRKQILDAMHGLEFHRVDWRKVAKLIELRQPMEGA